MDLRKQKTGGNMPTTSSAVPLSQLLLGGAVKTKHGDDGSSSSKKRKATSSPTAGESCVASRLSSSAKGTTLSDANSKRKTPHGILANPSSPVDFVFAAFKANGTTHRAMKSIESPAFNHRPTDEEIASYSMEVVSALRSRSLDDLRAHHKAGKSLQCCNRFGEALIHMACRRGFTDIVKFMVSEAGVSLYVHDDFGRTPLHYACWTPEPNFDLLDFLIRQEADLLLMSDVRGHLPFAYVRKEHWNGWVSFLRERQQLLRTREPRRVVG